MFSAPPFLLLEPSVTQQLFGLTLLSSKALVNSDFLKKKKALCVFLYPRFMEIIKKFDYDSIVAVYSENKPFT